MLQLPFPRLDDYSRLVVCVRLYGREAPWCNSEAVQGLQLQWDGTARELGTLWTVNKGHRSARCVIVTSPLGWEL